jgi:hypothetical protein
VLSDPCFELVGDGALSHRPRLLPSAAGTAEAQNGDPENVTEAGAQTMIGTVPPSALQAEPVT